MYNKKKPIEDVFRDTGRPTYTYVKPAEYLKTKIALRTPGKGVIIEGPSGIGKTTCLLATLDELELKDRDVFSARKQDDVAKIVRIIANSRDAGLIIIDDFHYLDIDIKTQISNLLKTAADELRTDIKLILIGINNAGNHLVHIAPDLNDRIEIIKFGTAKEDKIKELIEKGEKALNISIHDKESIIRYSMGSFHIAQLLCQTLCVQAEIEYEQEEELNIDISAKSAVDERMDNLERSFSNPRLKFALGNRNKRRGILSYLWLLKKIAQSSGTINLMQLYIDEPRRKVSLQQIVNKGYLTQLINGDNELNKLLFFDSGSQNLSIDDPKFLFFLRNTDWDKWQKEQGFVFDNQYRYEIALSFSGEVREIAHRLQRCFKTKILLYSMMKMNQHTYSETMLKNTLLLFILQIADT